VIIRGSDITFDFTGSSAERLGNINTPPNAIMNALGYATKCISDTELPENEGSFLPIRSIQPPGTIVNPNPPTAVLMRHELVQRVADTIVQALAPAVPERICAGSCGNTNTFTLVSPQGIHYSNLGGGFGATAYNDGMSAIQVHLSKCMGVTVEDIELTSGTVVDRFQLRRDSGGPGEHRGGLGVQMDVRNPIGGAVLALSSDAETTAPPGLFGGMPGLPGRKYITTAGSTKRLYRKTTNFRVQPDMMLSFQTPGGGGYGNPLARSPELVLGDVLDGYVSLESALQDYGVFVTPDFEIDESATQLERERLNQSPRTLPSAVAELYTREAGPNK
jgi:N-methylhydantoinase B